MSFASGSRAACTFVDLLPQVEAMEEGIHQWCVSILKRAALTGQSHEYRPDKDPNMELVNIAKEQQNEKRMSGGALSLVPLSWMQQCVQSGSRRMIGIGGCTADSVLVHGEEALGDLSCFRWFWGLFFAV